MSYMNDDCDPFGIPYGDNSCDISNKSKKEYEYSFKDLEELRVKEVDLGIDLSNIKRDKEQAIKQLKEKLSNYVDASADIKCDEHCNWEIITSRFKLSQLENLKKDLNLKDINVECVRKKILGEYMDRIKIELYV